MKLKRLLLTVVALVCLTGAASATHWEDFNGAGDCVGRHIDGIIKVASSLDSVL